jgi:hypothetical protein
MDILKEIVTFVWAVINNWAGYFTGGVIVALLGLWATVKQKPLPRRIGIASALFFLAGASFNAWEDQRKLVKGSESDLSLARTQLAQEEDHSRPKLTLSIDSAMSGALAPEKLVLITVFASISNSPVGAPSIAEDWNLEVTDVSSKQKIKSESVMVPKTLTYENVGGRRSIQIPGEALYEKTMTPIAAGAKVRGLLIFRIPGMKLGKLPTKLKLQLSCKDVSGKSIIASVVWSSTKKDAFQHLPGMAMPEIR